MGSMKLSDFYYPLPDSLIARYPLSERSASRLLCLSAKTGTIRHRYFSDLVELLSPGDLLVCNNTRVIPARLWGQKASGGRIEMLVERILDVHRILAHIRASKSPKPASHLLFEHTQFEVLNRQDDLYELYCEDARPVAEVIEAIGQIPLPPYFQRMPDTADRERYQTVYAQHKGSVAAPTAGLHFDKKMLETLKHHSISIAYLTLHIGAGTFAPVRIEDITQHRMHKEYTQVDAMLCEQVKQTKERGGRVIAVGTTSARSLEAASRSGMISPYEGDTDIFIYPGFEFHCVDALVTNFHLPASTLLMLVAALAGYQSIMTAYQEAIREQYRFFSYGDAMFIDTTR